ncbi:unannotated protein [freshwater metagenome]|uniref:Unannotated protein n=1 Tax=freshwater metagenome TaxID=449393 RepID=A0A6J6XTW7_9ZZZZ
MNDSPHDPILRLQSSGGSAITIEPVSVMPKACWSRTPLEIHASSSVFDGEAPPTPAATMCGKVEVSNAGC